MPTDESAAPEMRPVETVRTVELPPDASPADPTAPSGGVALAHEVLGSGPALFLVGAPVGRTGFAALARELASQFTVITHDPRGIDASTGASGSPTPTPEVLADDLAGLINHLDTGPARFFGSSGGAVTLLALLARHRGLAVRTVLHEAPLLTLLDDPALTRRAKDAFAVAEQDPQLATQEFSDLTGAGHSTGPEDALPEHTPLPPLPDAALDRNRYFLGQMAGPTMLHQPDFAALTGQDLVIAAGRRSHHQLARRASAALAERLEVPLQDLPGNHLAPSIDPLEFAAALSPLLAG